MRTIAEARYPHSILSLDDLIDDGDLLRGEDIEVGISQRDRLLLWVPATAVPLNGKQLLRFKCVQHLFATIRHRTIWSFDVVAASDGLTRHDVVIPLSVEECLVQPCLAEIRIGLALRGNVENQLRELGLVPIDGERCRLLYCHCEPL